MKNHKQTPGRAPDARPDIVFSDDETDLSDFSYADLPGLIALWTLAIIVFVQFFTRYVLNDSLAWTEEIARYVLVIVAYFGAVAVTRKGTHIFLEFFYRYIPVKAGKWLAVAMELISTVLYGYLAYQAVILAQKTRTKMASVEIPKSILYWSVAAALAAMTLYSIYWLVRKISQPADQVIAELEKRSLSEISD